MRLLIWSAKIGGKNMKRHFVIDTSVLITYASYGKLYRLANMIGTYNMKVFVNAHLLNEFGKNLQKVLNKRNIDIEEEIRSVLDFATLVETIPIFSISPDPKDNFLFDLALQTDSEVIVTKEKLLLNFVESPIPIHDIKWFKEMFLVGL